MLDFSRNVSRSELAAALGVDRTLLWRLAGEGVIPAGIRTRANRTEFTPADQMAVAAVVEAL